MTIIRTEDFERSFRSLPEAYQRLYTKQENRFQENRRDSRLHIKKVRGLSDVFSFRITRNYRALFYFRDRARQPFSMLTTAKTFIANRQYPIVRNWRDYAAGQFA